MVRHHRCSLPLVANKFEEVRWFATLGSELFGEQVWICIASFRGYTNPKPQVVFATLGSLPMVANSLESRWANVFGFALALKRRWFATLGSEFFGVGGMD